MKKIVMTLLIGALLFGGWWAWDRHVMPLSPEQSYQRTMNAARLGDEAAFVEGFTADSQPLMRSLLALARNYPFVQEDPYRRLVMVDVVDAQVKGDSADLMIQQRNRESTVPMRLEDGAWRIAAFALEEHLGRRR